MTQAPEKSDTPEAMRPVPQNAPVLRAWNIYKQSADYANTRKWAKHDEHVDGSLWAAFYAGYFACAVAESAQAPSAYKCGECGRTQACSDVFCAWAGPDTQAPMAGEVANLLDELDERVSYIDHMGTGSVKSGKAEEKEWFDFTAKLRAAVQSLSAQAEALKRERDEAREILDEKNCPRKYVMVGGTGQLYCLHGSSSISAFEAAEQRADRLQAERDTARRRYDLLLYLSNKDFDAAVDARAKEEGNG